MDQQRLDKWLWCARFFKTRALAADAIKSGRVEVRDQKAKPATSVRTGDRVAIRRPPYRLEIIIVELIGRRVSAAQAQTLYEETEASRLAQAKISESIKLNNISESTKFGKLSKKERRDRDKFRRDIWN